jgi:predicted Fe-Mo cluster-binding NifX family protein
MEYKIAVVTEDGQKISSHFGMAPYYQVFTVNGEQILAEEQREKSNHAQHPHDHDHQHHAGGHMEMFSPIQDCKVLLCGGMGMPAYQKAEANGLEVVLTGGEIQTAVEAYLKGQVVSDQRRIHHH